REVRREVRLFVSNSCPVRGLARVTTLTFDRRRHMTFKSLRVPTLGLVSVAAMVAAAGPAVADVVFDTPIALVPVPANPAVNPSGNFSAFDISFADPVLGDIFIADRSNAGVDVFSGSGLSLISRPAGFAGVQPPPPAAANNSISGPDGVLTVTSVTSTGTLT